MDDLVLWLREQVDEDKRIAQAATPGPWVWEDWSVRPADQEYIARWDPARALAEVAAKRRIIERHRPVKFTDVSLGIRDAVVCLTCHSRMDAPDDWPEDEEWSYPEVQDPWPCLTARSVASVYAGRPGWRAEWAPDVEVGHR